MGGYRLDWCGSECGPMAKLNTKMKLGFPQNRGIPWVAKELFACQEGFCSTGQANTNKFLEIISNPNQQMLQQVNLNEQGQYTVEATNIV
jgi:hypothetical protein